MKRETGSRFSFFLDVILRPRLHKKVAAVEFMGSGVSKAIGSKICVYLLIVINKYYNQKAIVFSWITFWRMPYFERHPRDGVAALDKLP